MGKSPQLAAHEKCIDDLLNIVEEQIRWTRDKVRDPWYNDRDMVVTCAQGLDGDGDEDEAVMMVAITVLSSRLNAAEDKLAAAIASRN